MAVPARCLVLGGSGNLGRAVCRALAKDGARIVLTYRTGEAAAMALVSELPGARALPLDVTSVGDIERTVDEAASILGGIDAFAFCVGIGISMECTGPTAHHRMRAIDEAAWDRMIAVNTKAAFFAVRRLVEVMKLAGGNIVLVGSVDGVKFVPSPVHYAAAKAALRAMTTAMAKEVGERKIRVNHVAPGIMEGGLSREIPKNLLDEYVKHCAAKRIGKASEVASLIAWLMLENTYVTGQTIVADGGL